jgi:hypothetical protein
MYATAIDKVNKAQLHLVILGAGASKACLPNGDANGKNIPLMNDLHNIVEISEFLKANNIEIKDSTFEAFYSDLASKDPMSPILIDLNYRIYNYFDHLCLPDYPTIYDYLLLSLKESDIIATFNWDPFLIQAYKRVQSITSKLPQLFFLHGTVSLGICKEHAIVGLKKKQNCTVCGKTFDNIPLLYPTSSKDYENDVYIKDQWDAIKHYLRIANGITIFGYAAPESDIAAINLLKNGWGKGQNRTMEEIQIIDLKDTNQLQSTWSEFIHESHYTTYTNYFDSPIAHFPRRISEAQFLRYQLNSWLDDHKIEPGLSFEELKDRISRLLIFEN